jgi:acyl-CoA thioesterase-1
MWVAAMMSAACGKATDPTHQSTGVPAAPSDPAPVVLCLGDSLTAGLGLDPAQAYPALIQDKIDALGWPYKVVNAGVSGDTTAGGLRRIDWLLRGRVDVVVLALGANDGLRGIDVAVTRANLEKIIAKVKAGSQAAGGATVVLAGMQTPPNMGPEFARDFRTLFPELAEQNDVPLIPFLLEGVAADQQLNQSDGVHPNAEGQRLVAENVWRVLEGVLRERLDRTRR